MGGGRGKGSNATPILFILKKSFLVTELKRENRNRIIKKKKKDYFGGARREQERKCR